MSTNDFDDRLSTGLAAGLQIAAQLIGLSREAATAVAAETPGYRIELVSEGAPVTADLRSNRIRAILRDDVVIDAAAG